MELERREDAEEARCQGPQGGTDLQAGRRKGVGGEGYEWEGRT